MKSLSSILRLATDPMIRVDFHVKGKFLNLKLTFQCFDIFI